MMSNEYRHTDYLNDDEDDYRAFSQPFKRNTPKKDNAGFVRAKLIQIKKFSFIAKKDRVTRDLQKVNLRECLKFLFSVEGELGSLEKSLLTGKEIGTRNVLISRGRGKKREWVEEYNAFTEICLRLGIIDENQIREQNQLILRAIAQAFKNINSTQPIYIKAKLKKNDKFEEVIDIKTIEVIN